MRRINFRDLDGRLNSCSGYRQIERSLSVSNRVIQNRVLRLARNYLNLMDNAFVEFP